MFIFQFIIGVLETLKLSHRLGNTHYARWIGALRYILRILLCRDHFKLSSQQLMDILYHAFYVVYVHSYYWFTASGIADIPLLTLQLHKDLRDWESRDRTASRAALKKVDLHTDYLSGRAVVMALASDMVDNETKMAMADALKAFDRRVIIERGNPSNPRIYGDSALPDFVNEESWLFFQVLSSFSVFGIHQCYSSINLYLTLHFSL